MYAQRLTVPETRARWAALRLSVPGMLVAALALVPFRHKAFTIDDHVFMFMAKHATKDPLHPTAFELVWGDVPGRVQLASGPVMAWLLIPSALADGAEWVAHAAQLAMLALAVVGSVGLAIRVGLAPFQAMAAGLLVACTPAALGMAGTAMPDVPAMALGVAGLERLVAWRQERRAYQATLSAVLLGLAPLTRPHLVLVLGIGALLLVGDFLRRDAWRVRLSAWTPLVAAPILMVGIALLVRDPHPSSAGIVAATASVSSLSPVGSNLLAFPIHWVLALPLAVPWILLRPGSTLVRWGGIALVVAAVVLVSILQLRFAGAAVLAAIGAWVLLEIALDAWRRRDSLQLALWSWLFVALSAVPYPHLPSKYLLASAPAAAILVARRLSGVAPVRARVVLAATCALGVALGVAILAADAAFAGLGRRAAAELVAPNVAAGHRVWFVGHWGFQWYAEKAGGRPVTLTPPYPASGDLLVVSRESQPGYDVLAMLAERYPRATLLARVEDSSPGGRIMNGRLGAGFFSQGWGYLPWAWGDDVLDVFDLWRIE
jgi:hypothetical protein